MAYRMRLDDLAPLDGLDQHVELRWWPMKEAKSSTKVHPYSRTYIDALGYGKETGS